MNELQLKQNPDSYILGIGKDGINTVNYIYNKLGNYYYEELEYLICDTEEINLKQSPVIDRIILKNKYRLLQDERNDLEEKANNSKNIFVFANTEGEVGEFLLDEILKILDQKSIIRLYFITTPFEEDRLIKAQQLIDKVKQHSTGVIELNNKYISQESPINQQAKKNTDLKKIQLELIKKTLYSRPWHGYIGIDIADLFTTVGVYKQVVIGFGSARGKNRINKAFEKASKFSQFNIDYNDLSSYLMMIHTSTENQLNQEDVNQINSICDKVPNNKTFIWGASFMKEKGLEIEIVIIGGK